MRYIDKAKPFVKWAGGKARLLPELRKFIPDTFDTYHEPFLGGGALFFDLQPDKAWLSDASPDLVRTYHAVQYHLPALRTLLDNIQQYLKREGIEHVYPRLRDLFNATRAYEWARDQTYDKHTVELAAWFIALNKTCYNGLWRVNKKGAFNVPVGRYSNPKVLDVDTLEADHAILNRPDIRVTCSDFVSVLDRAVANDFVYFDPPYVPVSDTSDFTGFTPEGFGIDKQQDLVNVTERLVDIGCYVVLSNADTPWVRAKYADYELHQVFCGRSINSKGKKRHPVPELIIVADGREQTA